jgi:hypothetical protein
MIRIIKIPSTGPKKGPRYNIPEFEVNRWTWLVHGTRRTSVIFFPCGQVEVGKGGYLGCNSPPRTAKIERTGGKNNPELKSWKDETRNDLKCRQHTVVLSASQPMRKKNRSVPRNVHGNHDQTSLQKGRPFPFSVPASCTLISIDVDWCEGIHPPIYCIQTLVHEQPDPPPRFRDTPSRYSSL